MIVDTTLIDLLHGQVLIIYQFGDLISFLIKKILKIFSCINVSRSSIKFYNLCLNTGDHVLLKEGYEDQPDFGYVYPNEEIKSLFKED